MKKAPLFFAFLLLSLFSKTALADNPRFYARADTGLSINKGKTETIAFRGFKHKSSPTIGLGFGYRATPNIRTDITYSMITSHKVNTYISNLGSCYNHHGAHTGKIDSQNVMLNGYLDAPSYRNFTPYITAGAGVAFNKAKQFKYIGSYTPVGADTLRSSFVGYKSKIKRNFAWKIGAGSSFAITNNLAFDCGYNYVNLGKVQAGPLVLANYGYSDGSTSPIKNTSDLNALKLSPKFKLLHSHQILGGLRCAF